MIFFNHVTDLLQILSLLWVSFKVISFVYIHKRVKLVPVIETTFLKTQGNFQVHFPP